MKPDRNHWLLSHITSGIIAQPEGWFLLIRLPWPVLDYVCKRLRELEGDADADLIDRWIAQAEVLKLISGGDGA